MYVFCSLFDVLVLTSQYQIPDEQIMTGSFVYLSSRFDIHLPVQNVFVIDEEATRAGGIKMLES